MKTLSRNLLAGTGLALAATVVSAFSLPTSTAAFSFIGGNLGLTQRDFRVWNNFTDAAANDNTVPHPNFPGQTGAVMAIWKGEDEWASGPVAGNGQGDGLSSTNPILGDGGANLDTTFQGLATSIPGNSNVHAELAGSDGGVLAFTLTPISDGWTIQYYSGWLWSDGPGSVFSGIDLQGVACHEIGHTVGLGHSGVGGATMFPSISGSGVAQRSIEADDIAGIQAIYGAKSATKPVIVGLAGSKQIGATLILNGSNFSATGNEVWFTKAAPSDGNPVKVTGVSSSAGGTSISVVVPFGVQDGDVLVKNSAGSTGANLSNAFPIDIGGINAGQFISFGVGLDGIAGMPVLTGSGDLNGGSAIGFQLLTENAFPNQPAVIYFSLSQAAVPFKGGTFYPFPVLTEIPMVIDGNFQALVTGTMPITAPSGLTIICQSWIKDIFAIHGFSATNGVKLITP